MEAHNMIEVRGLSKSFGRRRVIDNIDLTVKKGDIFGFLGPNGSGKTTTIRMLLGLIHPDKGTVRINGHDLKTDFSNAIKGVGAVVETPKFHSYLSGRKNLELMANLIPNLPEDRVDTVLAMVGMSRRADDKVRTYSLGMKQRLGIANALLGNPELVILDEPTNGLDPAGMKEIRDIILRLAGKENITFLISTHLLFEVEQICSRVAILQRGKILAEGDVKELLSNNNEKLEIYSPQLEAVAASLSSLSYVNSFEKSSDKLTVIIDKGYAADLNKHLVSDGIAVEYLIPKRGTLEERFIELTKGEDQID